MSLLDTLRKDMFTATKDGDADRANILKMVMASCKNYEIEIGKELDDQEIEKILRKEEKKVKDSIDQFTKMGRTDLVEKEQKQLQVIQSYLPELMSDEEITNIIKVKMQELGIVGKHDMGRLMGIVMKELNGKADGVVVKGIVEGLLQ
jgi:uncharacterized protein YqeY